MKLLCVGDIHLGKQPSRLSADVLELVDRRELSPAAAWARTVCEAVRQKVDAVLFAGDVVEQNDDFFEAYGDLRRGVDKLTTAGIAVVAVAGNHDVEVLPRLADSLPSFRLLGRDGRWETTPLRAGDGTKIRVVGWSFPESSVLKSPLLDGLPAHNDELTIGLLHCDRDQPASHYAPVRSSELADAPVAAWLLGHIHAPDALAPPRPDGYLGSLTATDPGEPGARGPWLLELDSQSIAGIEQIPLAPLRWETVDISVDALDDPEDVRGLIIAALDRLHEQLSDSSYLPRALGCRLRFVGRTAYRHELEQVLTTDDPRRPHERDGIIYFVHDWRLEASPAIDLAELAQGADPAALLARKLMVLRGDESQARGALIQHARQQFAGIQRKRYYAPLRATPPPAEQVAKILEAAALRLLDELMAQREAPA